MATRAPVLSFLPPPLTRRPSCPHVPIPQVVDALNFCFWPDGELEYEHVAGGVKRCAERDPSSVAPETLAKLTPQELRAMLAWPRSLPNEEERARLLADRSSVEAATIVEAAKVGMPARSVSSLDRRHAVHDSGWHGADGRYGDGIQFAMRALVRRV